MPGDQIQRFKSALIQVIVTGVGAPGDVDMHGIPPVMFRSISEHLIPLIEWRVTKVSSPRKEAYRRILSWVRQRIQKVLKGEKEVENGQNQENREACEFDKDDVRREVEALLEFPGILTFSRILDENRDNPECEDAFKTIDLGNNSSTGNSESSSYVLLGDTSAVQDADTSFLVFPDIVKKA